MRPETLEPGPSFVVATVGGVVAAILFLALLYGAPGLGLPSVDPLRVLGGVLATGMDGALAVGAILYLLGAWIVVPVAYVAVWRGLPGGTGLAGAVAKGAVWGAILWVVLGGVLLPLAGAVNRVAEVMNPGPLAVATGLAGGLLLLLAHLVYGLALSLVAWLGQGLAPLDTIGWEGYRRAEHRPAPVRRVPP